MSAFVAVSVLTSSLVFTFACVKAQPPTDTVESLTPTGPDSATASATSAGQPLAYDPDLKAVFDADCVVCHGVFRLDAGYSMTSYAQVMRAVQPGDAASALVIVTQRNGSMYPFFSGNRAVKSQMVLDWVVTGAAQTR